MMWVAVEVHTWSQFKVRTYGPYETREEAERKRRDRHMDFILNSSYRLPRTVVTEIEEMA